MTKKVLLVLATLLFALPAGAAKYVGELTTTTPSGHTVYYTLYDDGTASVDHADGATYEGDLVIPSTVDYGGTIYTVRTVEHLAFAGYTGLTSVTLGDSITTLIGRAFYGCTSLQTVDAPGVTTMQAYEIELPGNFIYHIFEMFAECSALVEVNLPQLEKVCIAAFQNCTSLESLSLPKVKSVDHGAFTGCSALKEVSLPECTSVSVGSSLSDSPFLGCSQLQTVSLPKLPTVMIHLFSDCATLIEVDLSACTSVGEFTFNGCTSLLSISLPLCTSIGSNAFYGCSSLASVSAPVCTAVRYEAFSGCGMLAEVEMDACISVGQKAFMDCTSLQGIELPLCTAVAAEAFRNCTGLVSADLPLCTSLGENGFYGCTSLAEVDLSSLDTVRSYTFYNCSNLVEVNLTKCVAIGEWAFSGCSSLSAIDLPQCTTIDYYAFYSCSSLTEISIPKCTTIGTRAFAYSGLVEVDISKCTSAGGSPFYNCTALQSATLPKNFDVPAGLFSGCSSLQDIDLSRCTSIGAGAFRYCTSLAEIDLSSCTSIGEEAFYKCTSLDMVELYGVQSIGSKAFQYSGVTYADLTDCDTLGESIFEYCTNLAEVDLTGITAIPKRAFHGCTALTDYTIPSSVTTIGEWAFYNCPSQLVVVPDGVQSIGAYAFKGVYILYYHGEATGAPWGAQYLNGMVGDGLYYSFNADSTLTLHAEGNANPTQNSACDHTKLKSIEVDTANTSYASVDGVLYSKDLTTLVRVPMRYGRNLTIDSNLTTVQATAMNKSLIDTLFFLAPLCKPVGNPNYNSFANNPHVKVLEVGKDVTFLHHFFYNAQGLVDINVHPDNPYYHSTNGLLTDAADTILLRYPAGRPVASFTLPSNYKVLGNRSFYHADSLVTLNLAGVHTIADTVFNCCLSLAHIAMDSVKKIGQRAFISCSSLRTITLPASLDTIGINAFAYTKLDTVYFNARHLVLKGQYYDKHVQIFRQAEVHNIVFGEEVESLPDEFVYGNGLLTTVQLPASLTSIGARAFMDCTALKEITIGAGVTAIGSQAFSGCSLRTVQWNSVASVKQGAKYSTQTAYTTGVDAHPFGGGHVDRLVVGEGVRQMPLVWHTDVDTLELPMSLDTVFEFGLHNTTATSDLKHVVFNSKNLVYRHIEYGFYYVPVNKYGSEPWYTDHATGLFPRATQLQQVVFGDSVQSIPAFCFRDCSTLQQFVDLELPSSVTSIGGGAFEGCTQIERATIGQGVTHVGAAPFLRCSNLRSLTFNATAAADLSDEPGMPSVTRVRANNGAINLNPNDAAPRRMQPLAWLSNLPPIDTLHVGPGVTELPACLVGYPWVYTVDTAGTGRTLHLDIDTSVHLRRIGGGVFANLHLEGDADALLGDSIRTIGDAAFMNSHGISRVMLPEGFTSLGQRAFFNCPEVDSVSLPSTLTAIGGHAFADDSLLSYLYFDCDSAYIADDDLDYFAFTTTPFNHTVALHAVDFGPHVRYLTRRMFKNAEGLQRVVLPEGVLSVDEECFFTNVNANNPTDQQVGGSSLQYVDLPSSVTTIGGGAFSTGGHHAIDTIVCRAVNPPTLANSHYLVTLNEYNVAQSELTDMPAFDTLTKQQGLLMVPCHRVNNYSNYYHYAYTERWGDFVNVAGVQPYDVQLTVNVDTMGTATWQCAGTGVQLTATPAAGHHFVQWSDGNTDNPRTVVLESDTSFEAQFAWGEYFTLSVVSADATRGSVTGGGTYLQGTVLLLTATPLTGYHFSQWSDGSTQNPRYYTLNGNDTLTASFVPNQYALTVECNSGQGVVSGGGNYDYNTTHSISATPAVGYHFTQWSDGNTDNPRTVTLTQDTTFTALFAINVYTLTVTAGEHGTVSGGGDYEHGTEATLTATADEGYHFSQWSDGSTDNPYTITLTADLTLTATFDPDQYAVNTTIGCGDEEVNSVSTSADIADYGATVTLTATAGEGYYFSQWDDGVTTNPRSVTITQDTTFAACFLLHSFTLTLSCNEGEGSVSAEGSYDGSGSYHYGDTATLTATPAAGWQFARWSDYNMDNPRTLVVTSDIALTALFEPQQGIADVWAEEGITVTVVDGRIVVQGAEGRTVQLYDAIGRRIADLGQRQPRGVYLLQVDGLPARRVIVM